MYGTKVGMALERSPGGGGGGRGVEFLTKFNTGRFHPKVQPLTLLYTTLAEKVPLLYTFYWEKVPLSHPTLEYYNPFLSPCNKAMNIIVHSKCFPVSDWLKPHA